MAQHLATTQPQTSRAILSCEPLLSDKLSALLVSSDSPVVGPNTVAELRAWIAVPRTEPDLPTMERVENLVARLSLATKERAASPAEAKERLDLYWRVLHDVPLIDLARAFDKILATMTFMPTPAEVRRAADRFTVMRSYRLSRARHLIWLHETQYVPPVDDPVTAEDIAAIRAATEAQFPSERDAA